MSSLGWTIPALIVLIFASWTTNDNNLYSASLGLSAIYPKIEKWKLAVVAGVLGTLLAIMGILDQFIPWLILLSIVIPPVAGIYIADHLALNRKSKKIESGFNSTAFMVWIIASFIGYAATPIASQGLGLLTLTTIPALDSIVVAFVLYFILGSLKK
jgi:cytosine permease